MSDTVLFGIPPLTYKDALEKAKADAYIRRLEAVVQAARKLAAKSHPEDTYTSGIYDALVALDAAQSAKEGSK